MAILGERSASQILRTYLPMQTVDLKGGIYRVKEWPGAHPIPIDTALARRRLLREIGSFESSGADNGMAARLRGGAPVEVVKLDTDRGVAVERYPLVWICGACRRIGQSDNRNCRCGQRRWAQLQFVGFHSCGAIEQPWIRPCPVHNETQMLSTPSSKASDIRFVCPVCQQVTQTGLGFNRPCPCGQGTYTWNVHKARSVYAPCSLSWVNPAQPERIRELAELGGQSSALNWVIAGMPTPKPTTVVPTETRAEFVAGLIAKGVDPELAETVAIQTAAAGTFDSTKIDLSDRLTPEALQDAEEEAAEIAMALWEGHVQVDDLISNTPDPYLKDRYETAYPLAIEQSGLLSVDLVDQFPVLTAMYGFVRRSSEDSPSRLVPFQRPQGGYRLHGELAETEALYFRFPPHRIARWLLGRGHDLPDYAPGQDEEAARCAILAAVHLPLPGESTPVATVGSDLFTLIHSIAHRAIRITAVRAGIDRDALNEYLTPLHLGFFLYAAARGGFVLGGLQAIFETELDQLLDAIVHFEHRCPLDPGCSRTTGACPACLHLGEPSCRAFNTYLDRSALFGRTGFFSAPTACGIR